MEEKRKDHFSMSLQLKPSNGLLLESLSRHLGVSKTTVIAQALRMLAKAENVPLPEPGTESEE